MDFSIKDVLWRGAWKQVYSFEKLPHLPVSMSMKYFRVPSSPSSVRIVRCPHGEQFKMLHAVVKLCANVFMSSCLKSEMLLNICPRKNVHFNL